MPLAPFRFSAAAVHPLLSSSLLPLFSPIFILFSSISSSILFFVLFIFSFVLFSLIVHPAYLASALADGRPPVIASSPRPRPLPVEFIRASSLFNHLPPLPFLRDTLSDTRRSNKRKAIFSSDPSDCVNSSVIGGFSWPREGATTASSVVYASTTYYCS